MPPPSTPNSSDEGKIEDFKKDVSERAEEIILEKFPLRIQKLQSLLKSDLWQLSSYDAISTQLPAVDQLVYSSQTKNTFGVPSRCEMNGRSHGQQSYTSDGAATNGVTVVSRPAADGPNKPPAEKRSRMEMTSDSDISSLETAPTISSNSNVQMVCKELKPILRDFIENCIVLKLWVSLLIPKIEDGNNFGVSIQAEVVKEITYCEDDAAKYYEELIEHFTNRAKLCSKVIKYPQIEDYRNAIKELDERQFSYLTKFVTAQLLNSHALLHDLISKNQEKIKRPRGTTSSSMTMY